MRSLFLAVSVGLIASLMLTPVALADSRLEAGVDQPLFFSPVMAINKGPGQMSGGCYQYTMASRIITDRLRTIAYVNCIGAISYEINTEIWKCIGTPFGNCFPHELVDISCQTTEASVKGLSCRGVSELLEGDNWYLAHTDWIAFFIDRGPKSGYSHSSLVYMP